MSAQAPAQTPRYHYATDPQRPNTSDDDKSLMGSPEVTEEARHTSFQRPHREPGQLELGLTEIAEGRTDVQRQVVPSGGLSASHFRARWQVHRPDWLPALLGEFFGVFFFTFMGTAATAVFVLSAYAGTEYGSFLNIGLAYALGIVFGIYVGGVSSSAHFHTAITLCQVIYKGFPIRKAPLYILAQILGGYVAALCTYLINRGPILELDAALRAKGAEAVIFTPAGPAGIIALFPAAGRTMADLVTNEIIGCLLIGLVIWANLDAQNIFTSPVNAPWAIGLVYFVVISSQAPGSVALNSARDIGARFACATIWGKQCYQPSSYTALAALMNIPVTIVAAGIYTFFLSDTRRPPAPVALNHLLDEEREAAHRATTKHDELVERKLSRYESGNGTAGNEVSLFRTITGRGKRQ